MDKGRHLRSTVAARRKEMAEVLAKIDEETLKQQMANKRVYGEMQEVFLEQTP